MSAVEVISGVGGEGRRSSRRASHQAASASNTRQKWNRRGSEGRSLRLDPKADRVGAGAQAFDLEDGSGARSSPRSGRSPPSKPNPAFSVRRNAPILLRAAALHVSQDPVRTTARDTSGVDAISSL